MKARTDKAAKVALIFSLSCEVTNSTDLFQNSILLLPGKLEAEEPGRQSMGKAQECGTRLSLRFAH